MYFTIARIFHTDHGVSSDTILWALDEARPTGFFLRTLVLPAKHADLVSKLYGPAAGDAPVRDATVRVRDASDAFRPETPFVARPARPTRLLTVIGEDIVCAGWAARHTSQGLRLARGLNVLRYVDGPEGGE